MNEVTRGPTRESAIAYWEKVLATPRLPAVSHEFAKAALEVLRGFEQSGEAVRVPGEEG